ncbi:MAG: hypothetical protein K6F69_09065 [Treponema sp.]|nr:hypothetical protein [Treponema sp.]
MDVKKPLSKTEYTNIDIDFFLDEEEKKEDIKAGIILLTPHENEIVEDLINILKKQSPDKVANINQSIKNLEMLAEAIAHFPSLLERSTLTASVRTPQSLIESLIANQYDGDSTLHLPSKAAMGKGFLISKIHTFAALTKLAKNAKLSDPVIKEFDDATVSMMFTLMAEDVYLNLLRDTTLEIEFRRQLATSLIILWEHRSDQNITDIAPVLQSVWKARRTLAPAFGTMVGTSELLLMSIQMDEKWIRFIKQRLTDPDVSQAMEEFLFGLSYEQILKLRSILKEQGITAIGRDEVSSFLGQHVKTDISLDYRDFYLLYTVRRDNARARKRLQLPGPKRTLEDHFISFVMELNKEKQNNDIYAK